MRNHFNGFFSDNTATTVTTIANGKQPNGIIKTEENEQKVTKQKY